MRCEESPALARAIKAALIRRLKTLKETFLMRLGTMTTLYREQRGTEEHIDYIESMRRCRAAGFQVLDFNGFSYCFLCYVFGLVTEK